MGLGSSFGVAALFRDLPGRSRVWRRWRAAPPSASRDRLKGLVRSAVSASLVAASVGMSVTSAVAAPDPDLYPNVVDAPVVTTTFTLTADGTVSSSGSYISLPVGAVPAGTARVLHGRVVNGSTTDLCVFPSGRSGGFLVPSSTSTGANLAILESEGFPSPLAGMLPVSAGAALVDSWPVVTTTGQGWVCDFGTPLAPGENLDYTITVGVPVGGTPITTATFALRAYLEAAPKLSETWSDDDFFTGALLNSATTPLTINASDPSTDWDLADGIGAGTASAGRALGAYGVFTNDLSVPVTVTYTGFRATGTLARFLVSNLDDWSDQITLAPGESTDTFFMMLGSPAYVGNETQQTTATFAFTWDVTRVAVTVTFAANGGVGAMDPQTAAAPSPLTANAFTRDGYTFTGWNTSADGSGSSYADGAQFPFGADTTLYAQWTPIPPDPSPTPTSTPSSTPTPTPTPAPTSTPTPWPTSPPTSDPALPPPSDPDPDPDSTLADTGAGNLLPVAGIACLLLFVGSVLLVARRTLRIR